MNSEEIVVSISCLTFNHAPYIRQCLDGFLMQKTNFKFEVLIHDDASTDGTEEIIREYEAKYPDIIKPLYEKENQWNKGRRGSKTFNYPRAKGKYIALCEGDDYWTDPLKLQKQVDFLENNEEYSMCFHNALKLDCQLDIASKFNNTSKPFITYSSKDVIIKSWFYPTASIFFRNCKEITEFHIDNANGDIVIVFAASLIGKLFYDSKIMSVYRYKSSLNSSSLRTSSYHLWKKKMAFLKGVDIKTKFKYFPFTLYKRIVSTMGIIYKQLCKNY